MKLTIGKKKVNPLTRKFKHLQRYIEIINILSKYGWGSELIAKLDFQSLFGDRFKFGKELAEISKLSAGERIRRAIEELGPTFVKFGQMLSTRPDLVPQELIEELEKLQDEVPTFPTEDAKRLIETELGGSIDSLFKEFPDSPFAAASMAQVYKAVLPEGEEVAIKVQRPGIADVIEIDLVIMQDYAKRLKKKQKDTIGIDPETLVSEFARAIKKELNFKIEAGNVAHFDSDYPDDPTIHVLKVYKKYSTEKILTMELIGGVKITDSIIPEVQEQFRIDPKLVASRALELVLKQIFEHGYFHADPHPGNIRVLEDSIICFLDFGMMGTLSARLREQLADILIGVVTQDERKLTRTIISLGQGGQSMNEAELESDIAELIKMYAFGTTLDDFDLGAFLGEISDLITAYDLKGPRDFYLLGKALSSIQGVCAEVDPDLNLMAQAKPYAEQLAMERLDPERAIKEISSSAMETSKLMLELPYTLNDLLTQVKRGEGKVKFEIFGLEPLLDSLERITDRLSFAVIMAAFLVASALISISTIPYAVEGIELDTVFFFIALGIGIWLLISIVRRGGLK
uniref:Protein kinase UbiB n=1 Tax=Candidatus Methanophaga sp. ANME-1 ERB7 TaxID=2759913 RepID=A0A7G9ZA94_9EURY|nr:protein kinase UbiB [Methanosarcinales archaeon ANME-1 ERB7]